MTYYFARLALLCLVGAAFALGMWVRGRRRLERPSEAPASADVATGRYPLYSTDPEMREHKTRLRAILDHSLDGWWDWRIPEDVEYFSPRFAAILGYSQGELPNAPAAWMDRIHPVDLQVALTNFDEHVRTRGEHPYWQIVRYTHREGHEIRVICRGAVVEWGPDGEPLRMIGTHVDVTDYVPAEVVGCAGGNCNA